jgi:uncharacterized protein (TIGR02145 family)
MSENLAYKPSSGNYWAFDNNDSNISKYGYLYDWETACEICPDGWHLPSDIEWIQLTNYLGGKNNAGKEMKSASGWKKNCNGTGKIGFSGLPGGYRNNYGAFISNTGNWWSSSNYYANDSWLRGLNCYRNDIYRGYNDRRNGSSVRCIRD